MLNLEEINALKDSFNACQIKQNMIKKEVGQKLLSLRKDLGLNQQEIADIIGISRAALSYYEKGERSVDIETLYKLVSFYNVSIDYLFGLKTSPSPEHDSTSINEMAEIGFSVQALDNMWGNPNFVQLINDLTTHPDFSILEHLTYHSRYTEYEDIDNGYRAFLTSKLLYCMLADIFKQWYIDNQNRLVVLSKDEKQLLINNIDKYFTSKKEV